MRAGGSRAWREDKALQPLAVPRLMRGGLTKEYERQQACRWLGGSRIEPLSELALYKVQGSRPSFGHEIRLSENDL